MNENLVEALSLPLPANPIAMDAVTFRDYYAAGERNFRRVDLSGADLATIELIGVFFDWAVLNEANLERAIILESQLSGTVLFRANLKEAVLTETDFYKAKLHQANLEGAILYRTRLRRAMLTGANLSRAVLVEADLLEADLSGADLTDAHFFRTRMPSGVIRDDG